VIDGKKKKKNQKSYCYVAICWAYSIFHYFLRFFRLDFRTVSTVWYFFDYILEQFRRFGICSIRFYNSFDGVVFFVFIVLINLTVMTIILLWNRSLMNIWYCGSCFHEYMLLWIVRFFWVSHSLKKQVKQWWVWFKATLISRFHLYSNLKELVRFPQTALVWSAAFKGH
jgi:hypothetical protein